MEEQPGPQAEVDEKKKKTRRPGELKSAQMLKKCNHHGTAHSLLMLIQHVCFNFHSNV